MLSEYVLSVYMHTHVYRAQVPSTLILSCKKGRVFFWCFCFFAAIDFFPVKFHWTILVLGNLTKCTCMFYIIPCMHIDSTECHLSLSSRDKCMYDVGSMLAISQRDKRCFAAKVKKFCACAHVCPHQAAVVILCDKAL